MLRCFTLGYHSAFAGVAGQDEEPAPILSPTLIGIIGVAMNTHRPMSLSLPPSEYSMTPRLRVLAALDHRRPDRTPRDFWAEPPTWNRLLAHVGHDDRDRLLDDMGIDVRHLEISGPPEKQIGEGIHQNFWGERYIYRQTPWGPRREDIPGALAEARSLAELEQFDWPKPDQFDYSSLAEQCRRWDDYALLYGFADIWQRPALGTRCGAYDTRFTPPGPGEHSPATLSASRMPISSSPRTVRLSVEILMPR
jgi:hypothetical protein